MGFEDGLKNVGFPKDALLNKLEMWLHILFYNKFGLVFLSDDKTTCKYGSFDSSCFLDNLVLFANRLRSHIFDKEISFLKMKMSQNFVHLEFSIF